MDNSDADKLRQALQEIEALKRGEGLRQAVSSSPRPVPPQNTTPPAPQSAPLPRQVPPESPPSSVMNERKILIALVGSIGTVIGIGLADRISFWDAVICGVATFCLIVTVMALSTMKRPKS